MLRHSIAGLLLVLVASPSLAEAKKKEEGSSRSDRDVVCTYESTLGSHVKRRVCTTRADRDERAERDRDAVENMRRRGPSGSGPIRD